MIAIANNLWMYLFEQHYLQNQSAGGPGGVGSPIGLLLTLTKAS